MLEYDAVVGFAKSWGLFYLMALAIAAVAYAYWPSNRKRFDRAAKSILGEEDRPWR